VAIRGEKCELINFGICCFDELFNGFLLCEYLQNETELFEYCSNSKTNKMRKVSRFFSNWPHCGSTFPLLRRRCFCCEWNSFDGVVGMSRSPWPVTDWPRECVFFSWFFYPFVSFFCRCVFFSSAMWRLWISGKEAVTHNSARLKPEVAARQWR
jgi:hypothetical protein